MLYYLLPKLVFIDTFFNVFKYITVRSGLSLVTAFMIVVLAGPWMIERLRVFKFGQPIREDGPKNHAAKAGTPTMGGVLIIGAVALSGLLWAELTNPYFIMCVIVMLGFAGVGFADDYLKIKRKNTAGLRGKYKIVIEAVVGLAALLLMGLMTEMDTRLLVPFFKELLPNLGVFYLAFALVVLLGGANAVNLTDGLDGLAILPVALVAMTYGIFGYLISRLDTTTYLFLPFIRGAGELTVFAGAIMGAGLGFLWYNCHPAEVFMGDVGALGLGGAIGAMAVVTKHELALLIVGGIFVAEALSVILQVGFLKWSGGKRLFLMAPLHHHFEQKGWKEEKVIVRFWIVQVLLVLLALATLKLR